LLWSRGAEGKKKCNGGISGSWPINQVGWLLCGFFFYFCDFFMAFLCVSQQGEFKNTIKNFLGKIYVFIAFLAVSLHEEPKNTIKIFSKIRPENLKKSQKK
jgi:hypothetical protein